MKINGLQAEIENEGEYVILKLKMHPVDFVKFVTDCGKIKKEKVKKESLSIELRKQSFLAEVSHFKVQNEGKYPTSIYNEFYKWWTESDGKRMKFEKQDCFEVGKRIARFWNPKSTEEKSKLWQAEKDKPKSTLL